MTQSEGTTQRKPWVMWVQWIAAALFFVSTVWALFDGRYWYSLSQACFTVVLSLGALRAPERSRAFTVVAFVLLGVAVLSLFADLTL